MVRMAYVVVIGAENKLLSCSFTEEEVSQSSAVTRFLSVLLPRHQEHQKHRVKP